MVTNTVGILIIDYYENGWFEDLKRQTGKPRQIQPCNSIHFSSPICILWVLVQWKPVMHKSVLTALLARAKRHSAFHQTPSISYLHNPNCNQKLPVENGHSQIHEDLWIPFQELERENYFWIKSNNSAYKVIQKLVWLLNLDLFPKETWVLCLGHLSFKGFNQ